MEREETHLWAPNTTLAHRHPYSVAHPGTTSKGHLPIRLASYACLWSVTETGHAQHLD